MPELGETMRLVELTCARLCHEIGGLIGTVGNAVEMVAEDADRDDEVLAFASSAAKALTQRLRLMRAAWGPDPTSLALSALLALVTHPLEIRRIGVDAGSMSPDQYFSGADRSRPAEPDRPGERLSTERRITIFLMGEPS